MTGIFFYEFSKVKNFLCQAIIQMAIPDMGKVQFRGQQDPGKYAMVIKVLYLDHFQYFISNDISDYLGKRVFFQEMKQDHH